MNVLWVGSDANTLVLYTFTNTAYVGYTGFAFTRILSFNHNQVGLVYPNFAAGVIISS